MFLAGCENGTAGLGTVAAATGQDPKDVQYEHEVFLIRSGLVAVTRRGRRQNRRTRAETRVPSGLQMVEAAGIEPAS